MKKQQPWGLAIYDRDRKQYTLTPAITSDDAWNKKICEEQAKGRDINCQTYVVANANSIHEFAKENGLTQVDVRTMLPELPVPYL
ncbi:hypothetical protein [Anaerobaca lacustris]|uniref:Uncharacterized protein n=1 Tax=Anaerobaca lacustris TaxID=3044600 RepID=A0AAW6TV49_9BACT|nr:hypothetical protein [Sedimentisphaerales bacterium M17dextr]